MRNVTGAKWAIGRMLDADPCRSAEGTGSPQGFADYFPSARRMKICRSIPASVRDVIGPYHRVPPSPPAKIAKNQHNLNIISWMQQFMVAIIVR
jgi:hypothetical protein